MTNPGPAHRYCPACRTPVPEYLISVRHLNEKASDDVQVHAGLCIHCKEEHPMREWKQYWEMRVEAA